MNGDVERQRERWIAWIGLFIACSIVEAHGGSLDVESSPQAGLTFKFAMPLDPD